MSPRHAKDAANNWETPRPRGECARTAAPQEAGDDADESEKEKDDVDGVHTCESAPRAALERRRKCQVQDAKGQAAQQTYDPLSACKKRRLASSCYIGANGNAPLQCKTSAWPPAVSIVAIGRQGLLSDEICVR